MVNSILTFFLIWTMLHVSCVKFNKTILVTISINVCAGNLIVFVFLLWLRKENNPCMEIFIVELSLV